MNNTTFKGALPGTFPTNREVSSWKRKRKKSKSERKPKPPKDAEKIQSIVDLCLNLGGFWISISVKDLKLACELVENIYQPERFFVNHEEFDIYIYNWKLLKDCPDNYCRCDRIFLLSTAKASLKVLETFQEKGWYVG